MSKIQEALARGYNSGVIIRDLNSKFIDVIPENPHFEYYEGFDEIWINFLCVYQEGVWAEIITNEDTEL